MFPCGFAIFDAGRREGQILEVQRSEMIVKFIGREGPAGEALSRATFETRPEAGPGEIPTCGLGLRVKPFQTGRRNARSLGRGDEAAGLMRSRPNWRVFLHGASECLSFPHPNPSNVGRNPGIYEFNPAKGPRCAKVDVRGRRYAVCYTGCERTQPRNKNRLAGLTDRARTESPGDH